MRDRVHFKRRSFYSAFGFAAAGIALPAGAANLLVNPGFEAPQPAAVDQNCTGWTFDNNCQRAQFYNNTPGGNTSIWAKTFQPAGGGIEQVVNVIAGSTYNFQSYVLFESAYNTTTATIQLGLTFLDASNQPDGTPSFLNIDPSSNPPAGVWNLETLPAVVAPTGATHVDVFLGWTGGGTVSGQQNVFFDDADLEGVGGGPTNSEWGLNGGGDWNRSGNWKNGTIPTGIGVEADFFSVIQAPHTVFTDVPVTLGTMNFNNVNTYVIAGAGSLTLQTATGNAQVIVQQGTQKINLPTTIASNTVFNVSAGATLLISDPLTINAGKTVTPTGAGSVTYESTITVLAGGGITFNTATHAAALSLASTATASITPRASGSPTILQLDNLSFADGSSKLDLSNNELLVTSAPATVRANLQAGNLFTTRHGGTLGYKDVGGGLTEVLFTLAGDANLSLNVDVGDLGALATAYGTPSGALWSQGDFNYDGKVDVADLGQLATNYGFTAGLGTDAAGAASVVALGASSVAAVPEPATLGVIAGGLLLSLQRRRRYGR